MIALKSVIPSDISCYSVSGRSSALPDHDNYVTKLLRHEKRNDRPKSTESMLWKGMFMILISIILSFFIVRSKHKSSLQQEEKKFEMGYIVWLTMVKLSPERG